MNYNILFFSQFIFAPHLNNIPKNWPTFNFQGYKLATHSFLPVIQIKTINQELLGWIVGFAINPEGELIQSTQILSCHNRDQIKSLEIENYLDSLGGCYFAIILTNNLQRLYLDSCGSLAVVYHSKSHCFASTNSLIKYAQEGEINFPSDLAPD